MDSRQSQTNNISHQNELYLFPSDIEKLILFTSGMIFEIEGKYRLQELDTVMRLTSMKSHKLQKVYTPPRVVLSIN